jgi:hypothetical protein
VSLRTFSKSKLLALRQCPKRLWLEVHHPELREDSDATQTSFQIGHQVGDIARQIYDPENTGAMIDVGTEGFKRAFERTLELLQDRKPVFEAGFSTAGALAFADVMLPAEQDGKAMWRMVEVKSSTSVKDYYRDDVAVQAFLAKSSGVPLQSVSLAHIDSSWVYPGNEDYRGLLKENDLTEEAFARTEEVKGWIAQAQSTCASSREPVRDTGAHCDAPYACGFFDYCNRDAPKAEQPIYWLPRFPSAKARELAILGTIEMKDIPDDALNEKQLRVKKHTLTNTVYFDAVGAAADLAAYPLPAYFLDFETINPAVPIWKGTRPYQQNCFQFSLHTLLESGQLEHSDFLDLSRNDPSEPFAQALITGCGTNGPVYVYNAGFETARINELAARYPNLSDALQAINARVVDLLPIARDRYYHPSQQGSWSIKKVLPAVVPELSYADLEGVQDGGMAMDAFQEAIHPTTSAERKSQIQRQLLAYCKLDTYAMVRLWQVFAGRADLSL